MVKITLNMPDVMMVEEPQDKLVIPFAAPLPPSIFKQIVDTTYRGVAGQDGNWKIAPDQSWKLERLDEGKYKVTHNLATLKYTLGTSVIIQPGSIHVTLMGDMYFEVETIINKKPRDLDFSFSLNPAIS